MPDNESRQNSPLNTGAGVIAILCWGTMVASSRTLTENLGMMTAGALVHLIAGLSVLPLILIRRESRRRLFALPPRYFFGCGILFIVYLVSFYLAIGLAADRQQVIEAAIINYLWPSLTLALSVPLLRKKAGPFLIPGMALAFAGVILAVAGGGSFSLACFLDHLRESRLSFFFAFICAISWPFYSNLSRRWAGSAEGSGVPLFLIATGLVLTLMAFLSGEAQQWSLTVLAVLIYVASVATLAAYWLWERAMRGGNLTLVSSLAYTIPLLSTLTSSLWLGVPLGWRILSSCILVITGAAVCAVSVK